MIPFIHTQDVEYKLTWNELVNALYDGHQLPRADIDDILFKHGNNALLNRAAWIKGKGIGVKVATVFPNNVKKEPSLPSIHAIFALFDGDTGQPKAFVDGSLVTKWKTAADSVLGAKLLARENSKVLTIVGAGAVASSLIDAYREVFPQLETIQIWNRTFSKAQALAEEKMHSPLLPFLMR
jgi:ornithine cyclodeaminase|tara:strand:+ start:8143 stop:8685 length:543 start_codon:yes stop_codon:yes gene_type:complete